MGRATWSSMQTHAGFADAVSVRVLGAKIPLDSHGHGSDSFGAGPV